MISAEGLDEVLRFIETAEEGQLQEIMDAVRERYAVKFPQWEVVYFALHTDPQLRAEELNMYMEKLK